jgi:4-diphosphocytidyl-2-C-methyl-D-erythritol kinase
MAPIVERASPCKVNLLLNILGKRPDGYHELETVMHPVAVCDRLSFAREGRAVRLTCSDARLPTDARNLVHRAATAFLDAARITDGVRVHLEKNIPLSAGLGGGSGNAANTLLGLSQLFGAPLAADRLFKLAAELGSDVPFFLQDKPALATGRGELLQPCDPFPALRGAYFLLLNPGFGVSTVWAYQNLARFPRALNGQPGRATRLLAALNSGNLQTAGAEFYNSLEAPVLEKYPLLQLFQEFLRAAGAPAVLMSGSGSTTFAILPDRPLAETLAVQLKEKFGDYCWTAVAAA